MLNTRSSTHIRLARAIALALTSVLAAASAQAIPYYNGLAGDNGIATGFDNLILDLEVDYVISDDILWEEYPVDAGNTTNTLGLLADEVINETLGENMDRLVTWTFINNDPQMLEGFVIFLDFLQSPPDYSVDLEGNPVAFNVRLDEVEPMVIAKYKDFFFAGFRLTPTDFTLTDVGGGVFKPTATRTFRYTADMYQFHLEASAQAIAYAPDSKLVPEPATGLLLTGALLVAVGTGRKRIR